MTNEEYNKLRKELFDGANKLSQEVENVKKEIINDAKKLKDKLNKDVEDFKTITKKDFLDYKITYDFGENDGTMGGYKKTYKKYKNMGKSYYGGESSNLEKNEDYISDNEFNEKMKLVYNITLQPMIKSKLKYITETLIVYIIALLFFSYGFEFIEGRGFYNNVAGLYVYIFIPIYTFLLVTNPLLLSKYKKIKYLNNTIYYLHNGSLNNVNIHRKTKIFKFKPLKGSVVGIKALTHEHIKKYIYKDMDEIIAKDKENRASLTNKEKYYKILNNE